MNETVIEDSGIVKAINGNKITVEIERGGGCKSCSMHGFCMKNVMDEMELSTELPLQVGDRVQLEVSASGRALASLMIFGLPLAFLFAGFLISSIWLSEIVSIGIGFTALAISFLIIRALDKSLGAKLDIQIAGKI